jgi:lipopolysaccharide/colanic/teichoic acid biosynthesis glycosyltransferase
MIRILNIVVPARVFTLFLAETVLLFVSFLAATYADPDIGDAALFLQYDGGFLRIGVLILFVISGLYFSSLYGQFRIRRGLTLFQSLCLIFGAAFLGQAVLSYFLPGLMVPRKVMLLGSPPALAALFACRLVFIEAARQVQATTRVLFLGTSPTVTALARHFLRQPELGVTPVGYLDTCGVTGVDAVMPLLGNMDALESVLDEYNANLIVIGKREDIRSSWVCEFLALRFGGLHIEEASALYETTFMRKCSSEVWPSRLVFSDRIEPSSTTLAIQSVYSAALAFGAGLVASPVLLAAAVCIRWSSPGPVIERERRIGRHGVPFDMYRFRCPRQEGELTSVGKALVRFRLHLLPLLLNVLRGDMAIVGPRPEIPLYSEVLAREIPFYRQRRQVKPGLAGWAGVHDSDCDTLRELEYDLYYVQNVSLILDSLTLLHALKTHLFSADEDIRKLITT